MRYLLLLPIALLFTSCPQKTVASENDGYVYVEAEDYLYRNYEADNQARKWKKRSRQDASGGKYLVALPDTRVTHDDKLIKGENFSNEPGKIAIIGYPIRFYNPGRYYVWVRTLSTGTEDNGIHVGLNLEWPESGQRMQWCEGKNEWTWASKQRTKEVHCGVEKLIYLDIPERGVHIINFSMREDGFKFDAFVLSQAYEMPEEGA